MKILMLVNWKVEYCKSQPQNLQPPDYYVEGAPYWFFRYFSKIPEVDVIDISSFPKLENFEKNKIRFYIWQAIKAIPRRKNYDLLISHGMQSAVVLALWQKIFNKKTKHIVFDIGCFNSAAESGQALKIMKWVSHTFDGVIYHTPSQETYYKKHFPWLANKSVFVRFGTDLDFFRLEERSAIEKDQYMICVGNSKRDWDTLVCAYAKLNTSCKLRLLGCSQSEYERIKGIETIKAVPVNEYIQQVLGARFCMLPLKHMNYSFGQMTLLQQMALGKVVITASVPSMEPYKDAEGVFLYEPENSNDCRRVMKKLLDMNGKELEDYGKMNRGFLHRECNEKIMASEIEAFIHSVCG